MHSSDIRNSAILAFVQSSPTMANAGEAQVWSTIHDICTEWLELACDIAPAKATTFFVQHGDPPYLALQAHIPNIRHDLEKAGLRLEEVEDCAAIFEKNLIQMSTEMQLTFAKAWKEISGGPEGRKQSQDALIELHISSFQTEIAWSTRRVLDLAATQRFSNGDICKAEEMTAEWTDETRALMERVYQQHPKLEAHEKKLLAEASGLSLRQISIWVSFILHFNGHARASSSSSPCGFCSPDVRARMLIIL